MGEPDKYEYVTRGPHVVWDGQPIMDRDYERLERAAIPVMLREMSEFGWEFCGFIPGKPSAKAEHSIADAWMFRRPARHAQEG